MSVKDLLSQDEIDALLHGGEEESDDAAEEEDVDLGGDGVVAYDLANQDRIVRGRMPTLEMINERFARYSRTSFFNLLRRAADVNVTGVQVMKYSDYLSTLYVPTSMNIFKLDRLKGNGLLIFDAKMVYRVVDQFFGGDGRHAKIEGREFTPTEMRLVNKVIEQAFIDLEEAWKPAYPVVFELVGSEMNPAMANIVSGNDVVVVSTFEVDMEGGTGEMHVSLPYSMLEPIKELIHGSGHDSPSRKDNSWQPILRKDLEIARVGLNLTVLESEMTLADVIELKAGDVIPVDMPEYTRLEVNGLPLYNCQLGQAHGNLAVQIKSRFNRPDKD